MTTMRTKNGLTVPVGYGGDGSVKLKGASRPARKPQRSVAPRDRRTLPAGQVPEGALLRGQKTHDAYKLLLTEDVGDGKLILHVINTRTDEVRRWPRTADFRVELA